MRAGRGVPARSPSIARQLRNTYLVALQAGALVARCQELATRRVAEIRAVGRDGRPPHRIRRVTGQAALLPVAGDTRPDVALGGQRMAVGPRVGDHRTARVPSPARRVERLEASPGAEGVVRAPPGQPALGIGRDPETLMAADAERLQPVA